MLVSKEEFLESVGVWEVGVRRKLGARNAVIEKTEHIAEIKKNFFHK
jgi:hypothetical protein